MILLSMKITSPFFISILILSTVFCCAAEQDKNSSIANLNNSENIQENRQVITLSFLPINSFDNDNNQKMSEKLASVFAREALSKHLKSQKEIDFAKIEKIEEKKTEREWSLIFSVQQNTIPNDKTESFSVANEVIKKYYPSESVNSVLSEIKAVYTRDLKIAEAIFLGQITAGKKILEQEISMAFDAFEEKVKSNDSLFFSDKDKFISQSKTIREFLLKKITECNASSSQTFYHDESKTQIDSDSSKKIEQVKQSALFSKANILPDFEPMLMRNTILLENGGWSVFQTENGSLYFIAVGTAVVKDGSASDRIQRQKIAEMCAYSEIAKISKLNIKEFSQHTVSESAKNSHIESIDKFQTKVSLRAEEFLMGMPTVGTWYSPDGKLFFLAKGQKL